MASARSSEAPHHGGSEQAPLQQLRRDARSARHVLCDGRRLVARELPLVHEPHVRCEGLRLRQEGRRERQHLWGQARGEAGGEDREGGGEDAAEHGVEEGGRGSQRESRQHCSEQPTEGGVRLGVEVGVWCGERNHRVGAVAAVARPPLVIVSSILVILWGPTPEVARDQADAKALEGRLQEDAGGVAD